MKKSISIWLLFCLCMLGALPVNVSAEALPTEDVISAEGAKEQPGWHGTGKKRYYVQPDGQRAIGFVKIGRNTYYFKKTGYMKTGWVKAGGKVYYMKKDGRMAKGWMTIRKKKYFFNKKTGARTVGWKAIKGKSYYFTEKGVFSHTGMRKKNNWVGRDGNVLYPSTIKRLLQTALKPVGTTMYVWGGGWDVVQLGSDITTRTMGLSPRWKEYYQQQTSSYDYRMTRYQIKDGLDCSGYVGWVIYNTFNRISGNAGYVMSAQVQARTFASYGWGTYTTAAGVRDFKPGDIMSTSAGHVYIVVGECSDGSVVLLHSSPSGVMISGTCTRSGNKDSKAIRLAKRYMSKYYPNWYAKYPDVARGTSYITNYHQMRWYTTDGILSDPEGYLDKDAQAVLADLFS